MCWYIPGSCFLTWTKKVKKERLSTLRFEESMEFYTYPSHHFPPSSSPSSSETYSSFGFLVNKIKEFIRCAVSAVVGNVFSAIFTFFFALSEQRLLSLSPLHLCDGFGRFFLSGGVREFWFDPAHFCDLCMLFYDLGFTNYCLCWLGVVSFSSRENLVLVHRCVWNHFQVELFIVLKIGLFWLSWF